MHFIIVGISHKTAPVEIRERFFLSINQRAHLLSVLKNDPSVAGAIILSTCNRVEIYAHTIDPDPECILQHLFNIRHLPGESNYRQHFYAYLVKEAVYHLFKVASGVDSLILGEKQILGQLRQAVELSRDNDLLSKDFNILANVAIKTGKKAQTETNIGCGGSSTSWAAVKMIQNLLGTLQGKSVLIIGAGKMGKLAVAHLRNKGANKIYIMNRTMENSIALAKEVNGIAVPFWDIKEVLSKVDACVCSTSCSHYIIEKSLVAQVISQREQRPLILADIAMPRNIDPEVASIGGVSLVDIDDLVRAIDDIKKKRGEAIEQIEVIIAKKMGNFIGNFQLIMKLMPRDYERS